MMKHFLTITNVYKDKDLRVTKKIQDYICKKGGTCECFVSTGEDVKHAAPEKDQVPENTECVIVLGGDGTLIRAASKMVEHHLPLIAVNLGTLGYLCELEPSIVEERMMLTGYAIKNGVKTEPSLALNDIVIHRTGALSIVNLIVSVNGEYLNRIRADGIIISTPTGSTGYNMSAGGPIVDPKAKIILITPINAHNLNSTSIVIGADDEVTIEIGPRRSQKDEMVEVSFDGDNAVELKVGDRFIIRQASEVTRICRLSRTSFFENLRKKMQTYT